MFRHSIHNTNTIFHKWGLHGIFSPMIVSKYKTPYSFFWPHLKATFWQTKIAEICGTSPFLANNYCASKAQLQHHPLASRATSATARNYAVMRQFLCPREIYSFNK